MDPLKSNCYMIKNEPMDVLIPPTNHNIRRSSAPAELLSIPERHHLNVISSGSCLSPSPYTSTNMSLLSPQSDDGYQIPSPCSTIDYIDSVRSPIYPPLTGASISNSVENISLKCNSPMQPRSPYMAGTAEMRRKSNFASNPSSPMAAKLNHEYRLSSINFENIKTEPIDDMRPVHFIKSRGTKRAIT